MKAMALEGFQKCCDAVSPGRRVKAAMSLSNDVLSVSDYSHITHSIHLKPNTKVTLIAFGKASMAMASAAEQVLGERLRKGFVLAPHGMEIPLGLRSRVVQGAVNNLPDEISVEGTREALREVEEGDREGDLIMFLISGGGSALFCLPDDVTLSEKLAMIQLLVSHGGSIGQLNSIRQRLSSVKGGRTLKHIQRSKVISLIMSDVIGDPIHLISSGPTVPQASTQDPFSILHDLSLDPQLLPPAVLKKLQKSSLSTKNNINVTNCVIANNSLALSSLRDHFLSRGYSTHIVTSSLEGNAEERGRQLADGILASRSELEQTTRNIEPSFGQLPTGDNPIALLFGGETTVNLKTSSGKGGRNQHLVLSAMATLISRTKDSMIPKGRKFMLMSAGTDGIDGPTDAAGAIIDENDLPSADSASILRALDDSDSYHLWSTFRSANCHIKCGPTGTNVMDVCVVLIHYE